MTLRYLDVRCCVELLLHGHVNEEMIEWICRLCWSLACKPLKQMPRCQRASLRATEHTSDLLRAGSPQASV